MIGVSHVAEDAFIGGLLHDIGKVVMDQYQPNIYGPIVKYANDKGILLLEAEQEVMGLSHAKVGEWMMEKWRLPPTIVHMVSDHHSPNSTTERRELLTAIHVGDVLARALGIGSGGDRRMPVIDPVLAVNYNINGGFLDNAVARVISEVSKAEDFLSLIASNT